MNFLFSKRYALPLSTGEVVRLHLPNGKSRRLLYGKLLKISQKKNLFLHFVSQDKGEDLPLGIRGKFTAITSNHLFRFPSRLLFREDPLFIFSPPMFFLRMISVSPMEETLPIALPVDYRALSSLHVQRGIVSEFCWSYLRMQTNLCIPDGTPLSLNLTPPYEAQPLRVTGKTLSSLPDKEDSQKFATTISLEKASSEDKSRIFRLSLLTSSSDR